MSRDITQIPPTVTLPMMVAMKTLRPTVAKPITPSAKLVIREDVSGPAQATIGFDWRGVMNRTLPYCASITGRKPPDGGKPLSSTCDISASPAAGPKPKLTPSDSDVI
jgi:hypothetical protein